MQQKLFGWIESVYKEHGLKAALIAGGALVLAVALIALLQSQGVDVMGPLGE